MRRLLWVLLLLPQWQLMAQSDTIRQVEIRIKTGPAHINPSYALWLEDSTGHFLRTVFVTKSVSNGIYPLVDRSRGRWVPGTKLIESNLPYWAHRRGIQNESGGYTPSPRFPVPDAYTGATPIANAKLYLKINPLKLRKFRLLFEINQSHDFNEYYTESQYDEMSLNDNGQPSLVYGVLIDLDKPQDEYTLIVLGHGHPTGEDGVLYKGISEFTSALELIESVTVRIKDN